ncbi:MAG: hypothetical protein ACOYMT_08700, partial [Chthoniobacterales bacterium]
GDLVLTKDVLYQLSYMGLSGPKTGQVMKEHRPQRCLGRFRRFLKTPTAARADEMAAAQRCFPGKSGKRE